MRKIRLPWQKKRHRPNPRKLYWNGVHRNLSRIWRNIALILIFGSALAVIIFY